MELGPNSAHFSLSVIADFLDKAFEQKDFISTVPQLFYNYPCQNHYLKLLGDQIVSFCATYWTYWANDSEVICGTCIGAVATSAQYLKQGYASELIKLAEKTAKENGAHFVYLFSDLETFYKKLGYRNVSSDFLLFPTQKENYQAWGRVCRKFQKHILYREAHLDEWVIEDTLLSEVEINKLAKIWRFISLNTHKGQSILPFSEFLTLVKIPHLRILSLWQKDEVKVSAFFGKGIDFNNIIHGIAYERLEHLFVFLTKFFETFTAQNFGVCLPPRSQSYFSDFHLQKNPSFYIKILVEDKEKSELLLKNVKEGRLYPRTIQSA